MKRTLPLIFLALCCPLLYAGETRFDCSREAWLSSYGKEADFNMGAANKIKLKTYQEFGLIDFDVAPLKGKLVKHARLYLKPAGGAKFGLNNGTDLRWLTVSTVTHDWVEGQSKNYATDDAGHGATFNESSYKKQNWGFHGAKLYDVVLGNGGSIRYDGQLEPDGDRVAIDIDPRLVQAMIDGKSHGLFIMDGSVGIAANNYIASRESGNGPYLVVKYEDARTPVLIQPTKPENHSNDEADGLPAWPAAIFIPGAGDAPMLGKSMKIWAFPAVTKVSPTTGKVLFEEGMDAADRANSVWDGATQTVRLAAALGEIVSFQLALQGQANEVGIVFNDLKGPGLIKSNTFRGWRNGYIGEQSETAYPLDGPVACPDPNQNIPGQKLQALTVDIPVPTDAQPGDYEGSIKLVSHEGQLVLPLRVKVYDATIPDETFFVIHLNCYDGPGRAGSERFIDSFRLAHYHRATINRVPYNHIGRTHDDWSPRADSQGKITDWSEFDRNLGGALDGSWFDDNPRKNVPVPVLYLPLHENFPLNYRPYLHAGPAIPKSTADNDARLKFFTLARSIEKSFDAKYNNAWSDAVRDFAEHLTQKGYTRTRFEVFFNDKPHYGYSLWTFDEPALTVDWLALNHFARLFRAANADEATYTPAFFDDLFAKGLGTMRRNRATLLFRADVSRPFWQGSISDGLINQMCVNSDALDCQRIIDDMKQRMPARFTLYGSPNPVDQSNWQNVAWCLLAFSRGYDGVVPWQSLGKADALTKADQNALIIDGKEKGQALASMRLHALREGAQLAELLRLLMLKHGWNREQVRALLAQRLKLDNTRGGLAGDNAKALSFTCLDSNTMVPLKEGLLQMLTEQE
ncbi:MAG: hypothetical protein GC164_09545 [Phycisphaera sp.]|nr:hypothetical protein [Phycisphaera sp.]